MLYDPGASLRVRGSLRPQEQGRSLLVAEHVASTLGQCGLSVQETDPEVLRLREQRKHEAERMREHSKVEL